MCNTKNVRDSTDQRGQVTLPSTDLKFSYTAGPTLLFSQQVLHGQAPFIFLKTLKKNLFKTCCVTLEELRGRGYIRVQGLVEPLPHPAYAYPGNLSGNDPNWLPRNLFEPALWERGSLLQLKCCLMKC